MLAGPGIQSRVAERRTALRYPLRLPVVFSWQDEHGKVATVTAGTWAAEGFTCCRTWCPRWVSRLR